MMLTLANELLEVSVIDPRKEQHLLGPRYCAGGSIHQVSNRDGAPLLAGPEYPEEPSVINGQGAPEVFQHTLFDDPDAIPEARLIIGAGRVENNDRRPNRESHWSSRVIEPCEWSIRQEPRSLVMGTTQRYQSWSLKLHRELRLDQNALRSGTHLRNDGTRALPFRWFAHPFFPFHESLRLHVENLRAPSSTNPAFMFLADDDIGLERDYRWSDGYFLDLPDHAGMAFDARVWVPGQPAIEILGSFRILKLAVWANDRTCSPEPFFGGELAPGHGAQWSLTYTFESARP